MEDMHGQCHLHCLSKVRLEYHSSMSTDDIKVIITQHKNINFISSNHCAIFFLLYRRTDCFNEQQKKSGKLHLHHVENMPLVH